MLECVYCAFRLANKYTLFVQLVILLIFCTYTNLTNAKCPFCYTLILCVSAVTLQEIGLFSFSSPIWPISLDSKKLARYGIVIFPYKFIIKQLLEK